MKKFRMKIMSLVMFLFMLIGIMGSSTVNVFADDNTETGQTIHVSMIIDGYKGNILDEDSLEATEGESVCDLLESTLESKNISFVNHPSSGEPYISSIDEQTEFDRGRWSGWKYSVNGTFPNVGCGSTYLNDGDKIHWIYVIGVNDETAFRDVDSITLNKTELNLNVNDTEEMTATVTPEDATDKDVTWSSSDATVATVDSNGKITALKAGTTTIQADSIDNTKEFTNNYTEKSATCNVTVEEIQTKDYSTAISNLIDGISSSITIDNCDDWLALGLNKAGKDVPEGYLSKLEQRVKEATTDGILDLGNPTEYERLTLAVLACGSDPTNIAEQNLIEKIYNNEDMSNQGINAYVFGLIALEAGNFEIPDDAVWTKEKLINKILSYQEDGGWSYGGGSADPDMTSMALSALAPYYDTNATVKSAVDTAINRLSEIQDSEDGGFASWGTKNSESTAQVIIALCANGIDPTTDSRFTKNDNNPMDALLTFATSDNKGFGHADNTLNSLGTEQGLEALAAYKLLKSGNGSLYSFVTETPESETIKITNVTTKSEFSLGDDAKISIKAENNSDQDQDASLIVALYDEDGQFVDYVCGSQTIKKGDSSILTGMIKLPTEGVYELKAFVWDSIESMNPLSNVIEISVK